MQNHMAQRGTHRNLVLEEGEIPHNHIHIHQTRPKLNLSSAAMKLFHRFRKVIVSLMLSVPSSSCRRSSSPDSSSSSRHRNSSDRFEPPKTSFSSYYSSYSHYNEAIADCIEFINKSAQDGILDGRKSNAVSGSA